MKYTCKDRTPFTYLIKFNPTGQVYYGCRYAKGCKPSDLWTTYFTSSNKIHELINNYGKDSFTFEIRKIFNNIQKCRIWEFNVLIRLKVSSNPQWINGRPILSKNLSGRNNPMYGASRLDLSERNSSTKGYIWVNNGYSSKQIDPIFLNDFESNGFKRGMHKTTTDERRRKASIARKSRDTPTKDTIIVYKDNHKKHIQKEELSKYMSTGWSRDFSKYNIKIKRKTVYQMKDGEEINSFPSIKEAVRQTLNLNTLYSSIYSSIRSGKEYKGYKWTH